MKKVIVVCSLLCILYACNDRETDYAYNPPLDFTVTFEDTPIFEDDRLALSITIQQEDGENFGEYAIKVDQKSPIGKVIFTNGTEITQEWERISYGTTELTFKGITSGDYPLIIRIKDPYGKEVEKTYTLKVLSKGAFTPFANAYLFVQQQFADIWDIQNPTAQQISFWQVQLETDDETKKIDRDDVLVSFINNQTTKDRLGIQSENLSAQIQRAYLTLLQRPATPSEIEEHSNTSDGFKIIVGRIFRSKAYQDRFNTSTAISDFVFLTETNDILTVPITTTITANEITATLPFNIPLTALRPQITIPIGATISPESNDFQDFSNPVTYTVTAVNGDTQKYIVTLQNEVKLTEIEVLQKLYTTNPQSQSLLGWDITNTDLSTWQGVTLTDGKVSELQLSRMLLTSIPPEIGQLNRLIELHLDYNELSTLPGEIGGLNRLTKLNLKSNKLVALPIGIKGLKQLEHLDLNVNQLTILPEEIGQLTQLGRLKIQKNQLETLPSTIGNLVNLKNLDLLGNKFTAIPPEIGQCTELRYLSFQDNQLTTIPPEIGQLTKLYSLGLRFNKLSTLPTEFGQLTALKFLELGENRLSKFPPVLFNLTQLSELSVRANQLQAVPPEIGRLTALNKLTLNSNQFTTLPPEIGQLSQLTTLSLSYNDLTHFPSEIVRLSQLTSLSLTGNKLTSFPSEIASLRTLQSLGLSDNKITELPPEIGNLQQLESIYVHENLLSTLPPEIGQLTNLEKLLAYENPLVSIPKEICDLQIPDFRLPSNSNFCN